MKPGGGHGKGAEYERTVCKRLSLWLSENERDDLLWRSAMSGGRATVMAKIGKVANAQAGDISSIDRVSSDFIEKFFVECKSYNDLEITQLITKQAGLLKGFWDKAYEEADSYRKMPMLVAKQNRMPEMIIINSQSMEFLGMQEEWPLAILPDLNMYIFNFAFFVEHAHPDVMADPFYYNSDDEE